MQTAFKLITLSTLALLLAACGVVNGIKEPNNDLEAGDGPAPGDIRVKAVPLVKVDSANPDDVTVFAYDAQNPNNHFLFTLLRVNVKPGYVVDDSYDSDKKLSVSAQWNGHRYAESTRYATHAHFAIKDITLEHASIQLSARLINPLTGEFLNLPQVTVKVTGTDLDALVK